MPAFQKHPNQPHHFQHHQTLPLPSQANQTPTHQMATTPIATAPDPPLAWHISTKFHRANCPTSHIFAGVPPSESRRASPDHPISSSQYTPSNPAVSSTHAHQSPTRYRPATTPPPRFRYPPRCSPPPDPRHPKAANAATTLATPAMAIRSNPNAASPPAPTPPAPLLQNKTPPHKLSKKQP